MNPEQRLDRLEALARFFVVAERRHRKNIHAQDEKIEILINMQVQSEERFNERFARNEERFERMHQTIEQLVAAQTRFEENLQALIQAVRRTNFGGSLA
jgi:hypothetical protein